MAQVDISINGRNYIIACDDGQEQHLTDLGSVVNDKVTSLIDTAGQIGDSRLMLMASLLIADELADSLRKLGELENSTPEKAVETPGYDEDSVCQALEAAAERMESVAEMLEQS